MVRRYNAFTKKSYAIPTSELLAQTLKYFHPAWADACLRCNFEKFKEPEINRILYYLGNVLNNLRLFIPARNPSYGISERGGDAILGYLRNGTNDGTYLFFADVSGFTALLTFLTERFGKEEAGDIMNLSILNRFCLNKMGLIIDHFKSEDENGDRASAALKVMLSIRSVMSLVTSEVKDELSHKLAGKPYQDEIESFISKLVIKTSGGLIFDSEPKTGFYGSTIQTRITWGETARLLAMAEKLGGSDQKVAKEVEELKGFAVDEHCFLKLDSLFDSGWLKLHSTDLAISEPTNLFRKIIIRPSGMEKISAFAQEICSRHIKYENPYAQEIKNLSNERKKKKFAEIGQDISEVEKYLGNRSLFLHIVLKLGPDGNKNILLDESSSAVRNSGVLFCNFEIAETEVLDSLADTVNSVMNRYGIHYKYNIFPKGDFNLMGVLGTAFSEKSANDRYFSEILWNAWQDLKNSLGKNFKDKVKIRGGMSAGKALQGPAGDNILHNEETIIGPDCNLAARLVYEALETDNSGKFLNPSGTLFTVDSHRKKVEHLIQPLHPVRYTSLKGFSKPVALYNLIERKQVEGINEFIARLRKLPFVTVEGKIISDIESIPQDKYLRKCLSIIEEVSQHKRSKPQLLAFVAQSGMGKTRRIAELAYYAIQKNWSVFFGECYSWYQGQGPVSGASPDSAQEQPEHHNDEGSYPYYPFIRILKEQIFRINNCDSPEVKYEKIASKLSILDPSDPELIEQAPVIAAFIGVDIKETRLSAALDAEARRNIFYERTGDIFAYEVARGGPGNVVIICIDDLQWSDHNTLHLLSYIMRRVSEGLVVFVNARKPKQLGILLAKDLPAEFHMLKPGLLHTEAIGRLAGLVLGLEPDKPDSFLPPELKERLEQELERNPFFVIEFCNKLLEHEIVTIADGKCTRLDEEKFRQSTIPSKIEGVIEDRIKRLTHEEHAAVRFSSVLGNILRYIIIRKFLPSVDRDNLFANTNLEEVFSRLTGYDITKLENEKDPDSVYSFKRALIGEKLYQELVPSLRKRLHKEVAGIFENSDISNRFEKALLTALHYSNAEVPDKSCHYYLEAGRLAREVFDNERSLMLFDRIDKMLSEYRIKDANVRKMTLMEDRGQVNLLIGSYNKALKDFKNLAKMAAEKGDPEKEAHTYYLIAQTYFTRSLEGDYNRAIGYSRRAANKTIRKRLLAEIQNDWARICLEKGDRDEALNLLQEAEVSFTEISAGEQTVEDTIFRATLLRNRGSVFHRKGDFKKAVEIYNQALNLVKDQSENRFKKIRAMLLNSIGLSLMKAFRLEESLEYFEKALSLAKSIGDFKTDVLVRNNMGVVYNDLGRNREALIALTEQHDTLEALVGKTRELAMLKFNIGESHMFMENYVEAEPWYRQALQIGKKIGYKEFVVATCYNLAEVLHVQDRSKEALKVLEPAHEMARKSGWDLQLMDISNLIGEIYRQAGMFERARQYHNAALELSDNLKDTFGNSWALRNLVLDVLEDPKSDENSRKKCGAQLAKSLSLARKAGQPENIMHCLRDLLRWKLDFQPENKKIPDLYGELKSLAQKAGSKQFMGFCDSISDKLKNY